MVPVAVFAVLLILAGGIYAVFKPDPSQPEAQVVIVSHDGAQQTVPSVEPTVGALLKKLDIELHEGDVVEPALTTEIKQDDFRINVYRAVPVKVVDGTNVQFTFSAATTPRAIARQSGLSLHPEDTATTTPTQDFLSSSAIGETVTVDRATPVNLNLYGTPEVVRTHADTVADLMREIGVKLLADDQVLPAGDTPITPNMQVFIARAGTHIQSVAQTIPMPVEVIQDSSLAYGTSAVRQQGSAGTQVTTYQYDPVTGAKTIIQTVITQPAVTQIEVQGTSLTGIKGDMALAGISSSDYTYVDYIISRESGWCPTKWQGEYGTCPAYHGTPSSSGVGYGLCQATPGYKMASAGSDWATNPITQLKWCSGYARDRYGGWYGAYEHWLAHHNW